MIKLLKCLWHRFFGQPDPLDVLADEILAVDWSPYRAKLEPGSSPQGMRPLQPEEKAYAVSLMLRRTKDRQRCRHIVQTYESDLREALRRREEENINAETRSQSDTP